MSQIDFFALGGLGEDGKNMYCLEIDQAIYILDAGLKYPVDELYGVDAILPDYSYLVKNQSRIRGLFLSHGHEDHIGAAPKLLKEINIPV
ncbi:MAG: MBL fold metallo-hydrolase, partial [Bacillota bacterium]